MELGWDSVGDEYDVQGILTHEFGHWLCLDHGFTGPETMYENIPPGTTAYRSLESDDIAGLNSLSY